MSATIRKVADVAGDNHGAETTQEPQAQEDLRHEQAQEEQLRVSDVNWEKAIAKLKVQGKSNRIDLKLQLAGVHDVKTARATLADHDNDITASEFKLE